VILSSQAVREPKEVYHCYGAALTAVGTPWISSRHRVGVGTPGGKGAGPGAPVVLRGVLHVLLHLGLARRGHARVRQVVLQAADGLGVPVLHVLAEAADVGAAALLHGELEVDVLGHADLLVEQRGLALVAQVRAPAARPPVRLGFGLPRQSLAGWSWAWQDCVQGVKIAVGCMETAPAFQAMSLPSNKKPLDSKDMNRTHRL